MSDLQNTLFGENAGNDDAPVKPKEINGQVTLDDAYEPIIVDYPEDTPSYPSPDEMIRESMSAVQRMKNEIAQENDDLEKRFAESRTVRTEQTTSKRRPVYVVGVLSAAVSLIFMGVALLISVISSPIGAYAAIKISPVMLVFLGAEILFAVLRRHSLRIRIDIKSIIIIVSIKMIKLNHVF